MNPTRIHGRQRQCMENQNRKHHSNYLMIETKWMNGERKEAMSMTYELDSHTELPLAIRANCSRILATDIGYYTVGYLHHARQPVDAYRKLQEQSPAEVTDAAIARTELLLHIAQRYYDTRSTSRARMYTRKWLEILVKWKTREKKKALRLARELYQPCQRYPQVADLPLTIQAGCCCLIATNIEGEDCEEFATEAVGARRKIHAQHLSEITAKALTKSEQFLKSIRKCYDASMRGWSGRGQKKIVGKVHAAFRAAVLNFEALDVEEEFGDEFDDDEEFYDDAERTT